MCLEPLGRGLEKKSRVEIFNVFQCAADAFPQRDGLILFPKIVGGLRKLLRIIRDLHAAAFGDWLSIENGS